MGLWGAASANMLNMVGVGPYITIPLALAAMGGPQAMLGWIAGALIAICDGMVWAELGAAMPDSGGPYYYLLEAFGSSEPGPPSQLSFPLASHRYRPHHHRVRRRRVRRILNLSCADRSARGKK